MRVFITKYAASKTGIFEKDAEDVGNDIVLVRGDRSKGEFDSYYHKPDWHLAREDAVKQARIQIHVKITSLDRQAERLRDRLASREFD
jgi:hypothetical protein